MFVQGIMLTAFLLSCFAMPVATAQGEWKWAHSWSGQDGYSNNAFNEIYKTDFDEDGNIYVYGSIGGMSTFDGDRLQYVDDVQVYSSGKRATFLVKLDTLGNVLWHKVLKTSEQGSCFPFWMEVKNDKVYISSNMSLDWVDDPWVNEVWLYYFDTLITGPQVHAIPMEQRRPPYKSGRYTCFATFDLDGNLIDNHFITTFTREIYVGGVRGEFGLCKSSIGNAPFHIDSEGNIFVYTFLSYNGLESDPYTIMIDGDTNNVYNVYLPGNTDVYHTSLFTGMKYKFSPDWELLYAKPMVDHTEGVATSWELSGDSVNPLYAVYITGMSFDEEDNMYVSGYVMLALHYGTGGELHQYPIHIYWDSTHYATINDISSSAEMPFLIKYSPDGDVLWCNQIYTTGSANPGAQNLVRAVGRSNCYENEYVYIVGCGIVRNEDAVLAFDDQGHILIPYTYNNNTTAFFVRYNATTGQYVNHGIIPVENAQPGHVPDVIGNRLFSYSNKSAIHQWCVDGTYIDSINISYVHIDDLDKSSVLLDSKGHLLVGLLTTASGTFGDGVSFYGSSGRSNAVFALYHDPEFATPYVGIAEYDGPKPEMRLWPNPATERITIESEEEFPIISISVADLQGSILTILPVNDVRCTLNVSNLAPGTYIAHVQTKAGISDVKFVVWKN